MPTSYKHVQIGYLVIAALSLTLLLILGLTVTTQFHWLSFVVFLSLLSCLWLFSSLTVEIDATHLRFWFGPGLIRKTIPLQDIAACRIVQNPWYYGWGIRLTPHGWLYNVSGRMAVELQLTNGKTLRIGTDDPEGLLHALQKES